MACGPMSRRNRDFENEMIQKIVESLISNLDPRARESKNVAADELSTVARAMALGARSGAGEAVAGAAVAYGAYEFFWWVGKQLT